MKKIAILSLFIIISFKGMSQDTLPIIDNYYYELHSFLKNSDADSTKLKILNGLAGFHKFSRPDSGIFYSTKGFELAQKIDDKEQELIALENLATSYIALGNFVTAYRVALEGLRKAEAYGSDQKGMFYRNLGMIMRGSQNFEATLEYDRKAKAEFYRINNLGALASIYGSLGVVHSELGNIDSAFYYGYRAVELGKSLNDNGLAYSRLGDIHRDIQNIDSSLYYYKLSNDVRLERRRNPVILRKIAYMYTLKEQPDSALYYAEESLIRAVNSRLYEDVSESALFFSEFYENSDPSKAITYYKMALDYQDSLDYMSKMTGFADLVNFDELQRKTELERANEEYQSTLRTYIFLGSTFILIIVAFSFFKDSRTKHKAKIQIEEAFNQLKSAQEQLVQQEKLASLGQLTAGIAHEIKNPLNFVNNFSEVSLEMIDEAIDETRQAGDNPHNLETISILTDIKSNLTKIHEHGSRADGVVKSMLQHSRGGSGSLEPTDLNGLVREYVNLSYHGMRAGKNPIDVDIKLDLDESIGQVPLIAEDFSRVILNLCNNGFDAMRERGAASSEPFTAKLSVRTKRDGNSVAIEIEDNGVGIPDDIKDKILQPFFTTKKGTQGTGLGLSITHDIVKAHGGSLMVDSSPELDTTFTIHLPISLKHD